MHEKARRTNDLHTSILRSLSGELRLEIAMKMSDLERELYLSDLRNLHPDLSESELRRVFIRRIIEPVVLPSSLP